MAFVVAALAFAPAPAPYLTDLFTELDARLPSGQYRIPSLISTPRGTLRFDYSSLVPVAEGETLPNAAFRRTLDACGLPLDAVVLAGKIGRSYLESVEEDTGDAKWRARAKVIDERFLHDIDGGAHDPENPMAFLEPASSLDVGTAVAPVAAALRHEREDATGVIAGPAAAVLRAVQRAGTFTAEDLGESGDPEAPATPATRLREVLAKAYVDVGPWADGAVEALWAELSRRESCIGVEKGKLVRVAHAVRIRVVAGDRCVLRVRGLEADEIDTRTFLGATVPVLQKSSGRVCTQQSPAAAAAALAKQAVLAPLGVTKAKVVPRGACETSVAPRVPYQLPGVATRQVALAPMPGGFDDPSVARARCMKRARVVAGDQTESPP